MRFVSIAGIVLIAILVVLILLVSVLPLSVYSRFAGVSGFTPLTGSHLAGGVALVDTGASESAVVRWRWCPGSGPAALCAEASSGDSFWTFTLKPGFAGLSVHDLVFSGVPFPVPALTGTPLRGTLRGNINRAELPWTNLCMNRLLASSRGRILLTVPASSGADERIVNADISGREGSAFRLAGDGIDGDFRLTGAGITGDVRIAPGYFAAIASGEGASGEGDMVKTSISRRLPCWN